MIPAKSNSESLFESVKVLRESQAPHDFRRGFIAGRGATPTSEDHQARERMVNLVEVHRRLVEQRSQKLKVGHRAFVGKLQP